MCARTITDLVIRRVPLLTTDQDVGSAVAELVESGLPALPVTEGDGRLRGIFGEREFIGAIFPGYIGTLSSAAFVTKATDELLERRAGCQLEPVSKFTNTEHVEVGTDYSDAQLAETFLHHRVLIVPVVDQRLVAGVVTRLDFFRTLAAQLAERT
jgi:CBS domain-containing protein